MDRWTDGVNCPVATLGQSKVNSKHVQVTTAETCTAEWKAQSHPNPTSCVSGISSFLQSILFYIYKMGKTYLVVVTTQVKCSLCSGLQV